MNSRTEHATKNALLSTITTVLKLGLQFGNRTIFIWFLGVEYLGLNGLFASLIGFLSLADLGIGPALTYALYKPIHDNDTNKIAALLHLYKKAYSIIASVVAIIGLSFIPFLSFFIHKNITPFLVTIYILFLFNSVLSYAMAQYRAFFDAAQLGRVNQLNFFYMFVLTSIVQAVVLVTFKNYILYLLAQIVFTFVGNLIIRHKAKEKYANYFVKRVDKISKNESDAILKNVLGNFFNSIGYFVVTGTDNLLISKFINLALVGIYSNYMLIVNSVSNIANSALNSVISSIGNFGAENTTSTQRYLLFKQYSFVNFLSVLLINGSLLLNLNNFISLWIGRRYTVSMWTVGLIILNSLVSSMRNPSVVFISANGLAWRQKYKSLIEAAINLSASLIFVQMFNLGINGILLGTLVSSLAVFTYEPIVVFKYAIDFPVINFYKYNGFLAFNLVVVFLMIYKISMLVPATWIGLFASELAYVLFLILYLYVCFRKNNELQYLVKLLTKLMKRN